MTTPTAMVAPHSLDEAKRVMRASALRARSGLSREGVAVRLAASVIGGCLPPSDAVVAGFWPFGDEIDVRPLLNALHARGHTIVLPATPPRGQPLTFHVWHPGDVMIKERFGTMRPTGAEKNPDFLLIPLLAFDRNCGRLGYGGGYYDRTLPALPPRFTLGCAFAAQEVAEVPMGPHDIRLDAVATENGIISGRFRAPSPPVR